jgi:F-type H+-transporting ATPase subunit b
LKGGRILDILLTVSTVAETAVAAADYSRLFDLDLQLLQDAVLTLIAVFSLFLVASYFLFNPAREFLRKRQETIKNDIETAEKNKKEAITTKEEYENKLKDIDKEAQVILSEARKKAVENENRIIANAKEEAARIIERAGVEADLEKKKAVDDMKKEMISIASIMAGKVVSASIDTTVQESLIEETLKEMGDTTWVS